MVKTTPDGNPLPRVVARWAGRTTFPVAAVSEDDRFPGAARDYVAFLKRRSGEASFSKAKDLGAQIRLEDGEITIVTAAHAQESLTGNLRSYVEALRDAPRGTSLHWVVLLNDTSEAPDSSTLEMLRRSLMELRDSEHPTFRVTPLVLIGGPRMTIGALRGRLVDAVCISALESDIQDPFILQHDADIASLSPGYFEQARAFQTEGADLVCGRTRLGWFSTDGDGRIAPELFLLSWFAARHEDLLDSGAFRPRYVRACGANMGFRLAAYCRAGGYDPTCEVAEDLNLGLRIQNLNSPPGEELTFIPGRVLIQPRLGALVSPRRELELLTAGTFPAFEQRKGASINIVQVFDRYLEMPTHLQFHEVRAALKEGDRNALEKVRRRCLHAFFLELARNVLFSQPGLIPGGDAWNEWIINAHSDFLGIPMSGVKFENGCPKGGSINWERSAVLEALRDWQTSPFDPFGWF